MITINCPHCKRPLQIPKQSAGQESTCEHCQHKFAVPAPATKQKRLIYAMAAVGVLLIGIQILLYIFGPQPELKYTLTQVPTEDAKPSTPVSVTPPAPAKTPGNEMIQDVRKLLDSDTEAAVQLFEEVRAEYPEAVTLPHGFYFAIIYAQMEERAKHETLCRWLFEKFPETGDVLDAGRAGKAYVLYPGVDNAELLQQATNRIKAAAELPDDDDRANWRKVAYGMAEYRLKNYQEAAGWLEEEIGDGDPFLQSLALTYSAMVEHEEGNTSKSLDRLAKARTLILDFPRRAQDNSKTMVPKIALKEAETLLGQPITEYAPKAKLPRELAKEAYDLAFYGKYQEAIDLFERVAAEYPKAITVTHAYLMAILYAQLDDHAKHETHCQWMFEQFPGESNVVTASRTGKAYVLAAGANNPELLAQADKRIKYGAQRAPEGKNHFRNVTGGMANYRLKNYQEAMQWLQKEIDSEAPAIRSLARAYAAMVEHERGNIANSLEHLAIARTVITNLPELDMNQDRRRFLELFVSRVALKEAETLLGQPITTNDSASELAEDAARVEVEKSPKKQV